MHENYCFKWYKSKFALDTIISFNCKHTTIQNLSDIKSSALSSPPFLLSWLVIYFLKSFFEL